MKWKPYLLTFHYYFFFVADYAETGIPVSEQNVRASSTIKSLNEKEIEGMRKVCKVAREVLDIGAAAIRPGITTDEIGKVLTKRKGRRWRNKEIVIVIRWS